MAEKPESNIAGPGDAASLPDSRRRLDPPLVSPSPWLTVREAAGRARCGVKTIYREVRAGRLRAARIGGRRELRLLAEWIDEWLVDHSTVTLTRRLR
jgi:excisionase family DNA binding protein